MPDASFTNMGYCTSSTGSTGSAAVATPKTAHTNPPEGTGEERVRVTKEQGLLLKGAHVTSDREEVVQVPLVAEEGAA